MPESTLSPHSGTMNLGTDRMFYVLEHNVRLSPRFYNDNGRMTETRKCRLCLSSGRRVIIPQKEGKLNRSPYTSYQAKWHT
jgi:hypothetical protein